MLIQIYFNCQLQAMFILLTLGISNKKRKKRKIRLEIHDKNLTPTRDQKTNKKKPLQKILKQQQQQQKQMLTCFKSTTISR